MPLIPLSRSDEPARHALCWAIDGAQKLFRGGAWRYPAFALLGAFPFFGAVLLAALFPTVFHHRGAAALLAAGLLLSALLTPAFHTALCLAALSAQRTGALRLSSFAPAFSDLRLGKAMAMGLILVFFQILGTLPLALFLLDAWGAAGRVDVSWAFFAPRWGAAAALGVFSLLCWLFGSSLLWLAPTLLAEEPNAPMKALLRASWIAFWRNRSACLLLIGLLAAEALGLSFGLFFAGVFLDSIVSAERVASLTRLAARSTPPVVGQGAHFAILGAGLALFALWRSALALSCSSAQRDLIVWLPAAHLHPGASAPKRSPLGSLANIWEANRRANGAFPARPVCARAAQGSSAGRRGLAPAADAPPEPGVGPAAIVMARAAMPAEPLWAPDSARECPLACAWSPALSRSERAVDGGCALEDRPRPVASAGVLRAALRPLPPRKRGGGSPNASIPQA